MSAENLRIYARAFYSDLMSGLISYELNNVSEFKFLHGNIQKLQLEYLYNTAHLQTQFDIDEQKRCVLINTSIIDLNAESGHPQRLQRLPSLDLAYGTSKTESVNDRNSNHDDTKTQQVVFPVLHSGLFGQTFLSRIVEYFSEKEMPVVS